MNTVIAAAIGDPSAGSPLVGGILFVGFIVVWIVVSRRSVRCGNCGRCRACGRRR